MKVLPVRFWLLLLTCAVVTVPALATVALAARHPPPKIGSSREQIPERVQAALTESDNTWRDPEWQAGLRDLLEREQVGVVLLDDQQEVLFTYSPPIKGSDAAPEAEMLSAQGGQAVILAPRGERRPAPPALPWYATDTWRIPLAQLAALLVIVAAISLFLYHAFLRPLARLVVAMQQLGAGKLDQTLPRSRVAEVDQAAQAFGAMAAALRQSLERQEALEQERRMTISAVAHDLRTPLFSLRGYLEGLATGLADTPAKAARYVQVCQDKADALEHLVADLFNYTRTEYLEEAPQYVPLDVAQLLGRLVEGLEPQAAAKGVELRFHAAVPALILGDARFLMRALENLLDNAIRHTPPGGEVSIACVEREGRVHVTIRDSGGGIAAHDLPHIFSPLYRGEGSRNRRLGGAGLGLAIARRLVRAHGGEIMANNAPGGGALFTCTLPVAPGDTGWELPNGPGPAPIAA